MGSCWSERRVAPADAGTAAVTPLPAPEPEREQVATTRRNLANGRRRFSAGLDSGLDDDYDVELQRGSLKMSKAFIQQPAPDFANTAVVDGAFKDIQLSDYRGKYLVLFFYPMDFTFVCPTEIVAFSDRVEEFRQMNCEVVACSVDSEYTHLAWIEKPRKEGGLGQMNIPLLSDKSRKIARDYGVLLDAGISLRGLFIIDDKGILRQITVNDLPVGRSVDETLRLVQAFQFTDKHGEVCPAGWHPGKQTIKPTVADSKDYFSQQ